MFAGAAGAAGDQTTRGPAPFFTSGTCDREKPLVRRAFDRSTLRVDVDGDRPARPRQRPGAEIVVDTRVKTDSQLAQMFTLTRAGLERVMLPAFEDGTMVVEGGGVSFPRGAAWTPRGALIHQFGNRRAAVAVVGDGGP